MTFIVNLILASLALLAISLERTYRRVPVKELKKRARSGDEMANMLYRAVSYGSSLKVVLWGLIAVTNAIFFVYLTSTSPIWFSFMAIVAVLWYGFLWLPARDVSKYSNWIAVKLAPVIGWILEFIHPLVNKAAKFIDKHRPVTVHTGLYDKEDLIELIDSQKIQTENRIDKSELEMVKNVLKFGEKKVIDYLIPRRQVTTVSIDDSVGPILMEEIHKSGHSRFPVYEGNKDNIVGILYYKDVVGRKEAGHVSKLIRKDVYYIHEEQSLYDVMQAAIKVRQHLFIVVNSFEEYVGIISIEDVLEQIIGQQIVDEFDQYDDLRAVASVVASKEHKAHKKTEEIIEPTAKPENIPKTD